MTAPKPRPVTRKPKTLTSRERRLLQRYQQRIVRIVRAHLHHDDTAGKFAMADYSNTTVRIIVAAILSAPLQEQVATHPRSKPAKKDRKP